MVEIKFEHTVRVQKNPPLRFSDIFPNGWKFLISFYTPIIRPFVH